MQRREFLGVLGSLTAAAPARKPNILLLFADDLGYGELSVQGAKDVPTPNIDSIARNGIRFTNGYVSCPVCSPTRAGLMTGRYQQRFGHEFNPGPAELASDVFGLSLEEKTIAERLKPLGYRTGMVGKWHLGYRKELLPHNRGFEDFFGFPGGAHDYFDPLARSANPILRGAEPVEEKDYLTDAFAREAVSFIERHKAEPFFLYLAFNAVHAPLQAPDKYLSRFSAISDTKRRTFAAMLSAMDDAVGAVFAKLREARLEENTLIFFISDNGGPTPQTSSGNGPLRATKGTVYEGGIRVPFMMQWKGRLPAGKVYDLPVIALDVHPTALAAAGGAPASNLDGVDLFPYALGKKPGRPHETLCWRFGPQSAIRKGDWKVAMLRGGQPQLFNLAQDIGESKDLAHTHPEKLKELLADYEAWNKQLMAPRWGPPDRGRIPGGRKKKN
jgi:arylsulfatase A-like enzyme